MLSVSLSLTPSHTLYNLGVCVYFDSLSDLVVFDNSYSYFKNKRIRYSVILTAPVSVDELEKGAAKLEDGE